jgi:hypothetical protein
VVLLELLRCCQLLSTVIRKRPVRFSSVRHGYNIRDPSLVSTCTGLMGSKTRSRCYRRHLTSGVGGILPLEDVVCGALGGALSRRREGGREGSDKRREEGEMYFGTVVVVFLRRLEGESRVERCCWTALYINVAGLAAKGTLSGPRR